MGYRLRKPGCGSPAAAGARRLFATAFDEHAIRAFELAVEEHHVRPKLIDERERLQAISRRPDAFDVGVGVEKAPQPGASGVFEPPRVPGRALPLR